MLTVLIATRNGSKKLAKTFPAYCGLHTPPGGWKLVVIDNGSTDATKSVIESFRSRLPLTYVFQPSPGKNAALSLGLNYVDGDLVVFSDDDCIPQSEWLTEMRATCDANPGFSVFGGRTIPRWPSRPEHWILDCAPMGPTFTVSDSGLVEGPTQPSNVFGTNMAVRTMVFENGYEFCTSIGPKGVSYPMGSETEFVRRLTRAGFRCWYSPKVVVEHLIDAEHLRKSWMLRRAVRYGRGQYRMEFSVDGEERPRWFGVPRYLFRLLLVRAGSVVSAAPMFNARRTFLARWELNFCWGKIVEARTMRKVSPRHQS